jgi:hypothetical protein
MDFNIDNIMRFEGGEMTEEEMVEFFQAGIDSGAVWNLQGYYGRTALALIDDGACTPATYGIPSVPGRR